jgi:hypothetical protein
MLKSLSMPNFREIEESRVGKRPFLQALTWFGRYEYLLPRGLVSNQIIPKYVGWS